jgi:tetratricopeptide (TPR) repeat protein
LTWTSLILLVALAGDLEAARGALAAGQPREAIRLLGELADGQEAEPNAILGRAHLALREYEAAVEPLLLASDAAPGDRSLARDAAYACWGAARGVYARAYLDDALRMARRAEEPLLVADLLFARGDFEQAREAYGALEAEGDRRLHVLRRRAECEQALGREDAARGSYGVLLDAAIEVADLATAYDAAFLADRAGLLVRWLSERIEADGDDVWSRLYRGYARARLLLYREAIEDLRVAAAARPEDLTTLGRLCHCLLQLGADEQRQEALDEAEIIARRILARDAGQRDAWEAMRWLAWHAWTRRDVQRSYERLRLLRELDPEDHAVGLNFGAMARRLGRYEEAVAAYERLLEAYPDDPDIMNDLGIVRDGQGKRAEAVALWKRVLDEDPEDLNALENLFTVAWERGDREACRTYARLGLEAARRRRDGPVARWLWFQDRLGWAPRGHGG